MLWNFLLSLLLSFAFGSSPDGKLFNLARSWSKTKVTSVLLREMLFADDAALASHTKSGLKRLMERLS